MSHFMKLKFHGDNAWFNVPREPDYQSALIFPFSTLKYFWDSVL